MRDGRALSTRQQNTALVSFSQFCLNESLNYTFNTEVRTIKRSLKSIIMKTKLI